MSNEASRSYQDPMTAQLGERVTNLGRRQTDLENEMRSGFRQMETALSGLANETRSSLAALSTTIAERNKPQWQALGFTLSFCVVLGGLAYYPINSATTDLKSAVSLIADRMVTQKELEYRTARGVEDRGRIEAALKKLDDAQVPRAELERVWASDDQQKAQLQKQIDELKAGQSNTYSARDLLLDLRERLDRLERTRTGQP